MEKRRKIPIREIVFIESLLRHGFRFKFSRKNLKLRRGYVIPATAREDASGIDMWVKMPDDMRILPVQVTQRGTKIYRLLQSRMPFELRDSADKIAEFTRRADKRVSQKQQRCYRHGIAFVLLRDFIGTHTKPEIAWRDIESLRYGISHLKRHM